jgi:hypothetical protein
LPARAGRPVFFVDDVPNHHASVAELAPDVFRIHLVGDERLKPLLPRLAARPSSRRQLARGGCVHPREARGPGLIMRIGIDLGGTKIEIVALGDDGAVCLRERTPTPKTGYDDTIRAMRDLVVAARRGSPATPASAWRFRARSARSRAS